MEERNVQETAVEETAQELVTQQEELQETDKAGVQEEAAQQPEETMADYAVELEASFRKISEGDIISGTVIDVRSSGFSSRFPIV